MKLTFPTFFSLLCLLPGTAFAAGPTTPPNIVLVLIDDMGYGDIAPFGSTLNKTPNLDRMAAEGMKLTSFYAAPVCSPSRAQVMTGCLAQRVSFPDVLYPTSRTGLSSAEHTVAELLKTRGYATMAIGKWHLGDQPEFLPDRHGFDHYFGFPYSNDMQRPAVPGGQPVMPLMEDEKVTRLVTNPGQDLITEEYTDRAVRFITENRDHPFFLYLAHTAVHIPIHPGKAFQGKSANGRYGDWVQEVDASTGRVLDTLRDLKLDRNTLVVFTSDNGPWLFMGKDGGSAGPLRGGKATTWEGGVREPTMAWWPGHIKAGTISDAIASNIDLLPTFVSLGGGQVPATPKIDGLDLSPLLLGATTQSPHQALCYYNHYQLQAVRSGPWKLAYRPQPDPFTNITPPDANSSAPRLYNLDTDIGERHDLAAENPAVVQRLLGYLNQMAGDLGQDGRPGPGVRPPGVVNHPVVLYPVKNGQVIDYQ